MSCTCTVTLAPEAIYPFDARGVARRFRHSAILSAIDALEPGETIRFLNDHDPVPLLAQIRNHYGNELGISYVQHTPDLTVIDFSVLFGD